MHQFPIFILSGPNFGVSKLIMRKTYRANCQDVILDPFPGQFVYFVLRFYYVNKGLYLFR